MNESACKHKERDLKIPENRYILTRNIENDLFNDDNVLAFFYGGSIGNNNTDLYSDIDLRIIVKNEMYREYIMSKNNRAKKWGNVIFFEDIPGTTYSVAHYDKFIKVDTFYYKKEDIQPSVWLKNISIVKDESGFLVNILEQSNQLQYCPTLQEVEIWRNKFFAYAHELYRRINRNEIYYALNCLDNLRLSMVTAWYMDKGLQPNAFGDWSKYEGERSQLDTNQLKLLEDWHSNRDSNNIMDIFRTIIPEFRKIHKSLCEKVEVDAKDEWVEQILKMIL